LRAMIKEIEASEGFVANDGSELAEIREQLVDEAANYERRGSDAELAHQRKASLQYTAGTVTTGARRQVQPAPGVLVGLSQAVKGGKFFLFTDTCLGRGSDNEVRIPDHSLSRRHARILYVNGDFVLMDMGSSNGSAVNGAALLDKKNILRHGDIVRLGHIEFRFERLTTT